MPHITPDVRGLAVQDVYEVTRLKSLDEENARLNKLWQKPCWISGDTSRGLLGESTDGRPEAGTHEVDV